MDSIVIHYQAELGNNRENYLRSFTDKIKIIGVNPYVIPPKGVLSSLFKQCGRSAGPIPIRGTLNGHSYIQTLVKYRGKWRLYLNTPMRRAARIDVGDMAKFTVEFDPQSREVQMPEPLRLALTKNAKARGCSIPSRHRAKKRSIGI